jgi:hypothetical protein
MFRRKLTYLNDLVHGARGEVGSPPILPPGATPDEIQSLVDETEWTLPADPVDFLCSMNGDGARQGRGLCGEMRFLSTSQMLEAKLSLEEYGDFWDLVSLPYEGTKEPPNLDAYPNSPTLTPLRLVPFCCR